MDTTADFQTRVQASRTKREHHARQAVHRPHTSLGATGHWMHMVAVLSPLVIGELVKNPEKRLHWTRLASVGTAMLTEGLYSHRLAKEKQAKKACDEACQSH